MKRGAVILAILSLTAYVYAGNYTVAFIGLVPGGAPAFEESFNRHLQEKFSTAQDMNAVDYLQLQKLRGRINYQSLATVSPQSLETLRRFCSDSTVFIWGAVNTYSIQNARLGLLHTQVSAEATVRLIIYSFSDRNYTFNNTLHCSVSKPTGWIFFHPFSASSKVSVRDFTDALDLLEKEAVDQSFSMVSDTIKTVLMNPRRSSRYAAGKGNNPNISDVFNVPSVEAASVEGTNGPDSPGAQNALVSRPDTSKTRNVRALPPDTSKTKTKK